MNSEAYSEHSYISDLTSEFSALSKGSRTAHIERPPDKPQIYVVSTSSIPLSTIFVPTYDDPVEIHHGKTSNTGESCNNDCCMYARKGTYRNPQLVPRSHPGFKGKTPICFLKVLPSLAKEINPYAKTSVDFSEVTWNPDARSIFDERYGTTLRNTIHIRGWTEVDASNWLGAFRQLYWFSKHIKKKTIDKIHDSFARSRVFTRNALKQTLLTIDGLLIKKMFAFPEFCPDYRGFSRTTASLFRELIDDYLASTLTEDMTFLQMKPFYKRIKQEFLAPNTQHRTGWMTTSFKSAGLTQLWTDAIEEFDVFIGRMKVEKDIDYCSTIAWIYRCQFLTQTRSLGHLPDAVARAQLDSYCHEVENLTDEIPDEDIMLVAEALDRALEPVADIMFENDYDFFFGGQKTYDDDSWLNALDLILQPTASATQTRKSGGKPEDARLLLNLAIKEEWRIPIYNLRDGKLTETFKVIDGEQSTWKKELFWISYEVLLSIREERKAFSRKWNVFDAVIVGINEPGKLRILTKLNSMLGWVLLPASKVLAEILSKFPEHFQGFKGGSHAWAWMRRIEGDSIEAAWAYEPKGQLKQIITAVASDWTQASDFLHKSIGITLLATLFEKVSFPDAYADICLFATTHELQITGKSFVVRDQPDKPHEFKKLNFVMSEGYPMGLPLTKHLLHCSHIVAGQIRDDLAHEYKVVIRKSSKIGKTKIKEATNSFPRNARIKSVSKFQPE